DGQPFDGETVVEFVSAGKPIHFFNERNAVRRSSRIVAWFRIIEFDGALLPRYYPVICQCDRPAVNTECKLWRPKGGRSNLHIDAAVALGRLPKRGDKLVPARLFTGKLFRAEVATVELDRDKKFLPSSSRYSRLGRLTWLVAGGKALPDSNSN